VCLASAAIINTTATCDGRTITGTLSASCNDGNFAANAVISAPSLASSNTTLADFLAIAHAGVIRFPPFEVGEATASFSGDYVFTVMGGTGGGFVFPVTVLSEDSGLSGVTFAGVNGACNMLSCSAPFTFGVPQIVNIDVSATAFGFAERVGDAAASFQEIVFLDASGNQLSNVTFTLVSVPEPSTVWLLGVGLMCFLVVPISGSRPRGRFQV
jgi:hypothetical protein